jgi:hypothetical protein
MTRIYEHLEAVDQLADEILTEEDERREEIKALLTAIGYLSDPLLRRILTKMVELGL